MSVADYTEAELAEFFDYLDDLRESGVTNMFGAGSYLMDEFDMEREIAVKVLSAWMKTFKRDRPAAERAAEALKTA